MWRNDMIHAQEPDIIKGHNPEDTLQKAIKEEIKRILERKKVEGVLTTYFILEYFGLDIAVVMKRADSHCTIRFLELKAFVASRQGGVGVGNQRGEGSQIELLLLDDKQLSVCDEFIRWILIDGTKTKGAKRFAFFGTSTAQNAAMGTVRTGKQNNLRVNELMKEAITWGKLSQEIEHFLIS